MKGNENQGFPAHTIVLRGRDKAGHPRTQYVYVRWDEKRGSFQQISMYPNPFTVTGGEMDVDWSYEEETHTGEQERRFFHALCYAVGAEKAPIYAALRARFSAGKGLIPIPPKSRFYCVTNPQQRSDEAIGSPTPSTV